VFLFYTNNLNIKQEHEYLANGVLVHNCYDSVRYFLMSCPIQPVKAETTFNDGYRYEDKEGDEPMTWDA